MTIHDESASLEAAIAALQAQRALLGDAVVDAALAPMREQLARRASPVPGAPPEQTLRQVGVLFLDVVGSTSLSQHLDPEEVHAVMDDVLQRCTAVVARHGGKVLQYAGDNLLAAFGAEQAREDDSERAVRCGLVLLEEGAALRERVQRAHGQSGCDVRVGIHTGPVLLGGGVDEDGTIRGLTVNVAARMEQTAPAGSLRISHDTWLLVRGVFDVQVQPPLVVKGRDKPLLTYLVQGAKPRAFRIASRGIEGVLPPMVGRDGELAELIALVGDVAARRRPRAMTLVGEPGLGKSRLLHELQGALEVHAQRFWLLLGRAHPGSRLQPYGMLRDLLAWRLQIADSDSSDEAKARLVDGLVPWLGEPAQAEAKAHRIGQIIGLDFSASAHVRGLEPRLLRSLAFAALHDYLRGLAAGEAAVALLLEDLHWADDESLDFIAGLVAPGSTLPLALVATARPELLERHPAWADGDPAHTRVTLAALDTARAESLAGSLLHRLSGDSERLRALLVARSDGNPFYMEELVRMFLDDGVIVAEGEAWHLLPEKLRQAQVPSTLVGVLQARLDALPPADRLALQQASIVGYVFWDQTLAAIDPKAPAAMPALQRRSLVHRRESSAFAGASEEAFHHHLLQQVTYDTVLKPARRAGHAAAAQWLAERLGDRPNEYLAITGEHYERAGDVERALGYFERAALDAQARFANVAALGHCERALQSPAAVDLRMRERLYTIQQDVADVTGKRVLQEAALDRRAEIAEAIDDDRLRAGLLASRALLASRRGDETLAFELAARAAEAAALSGNADAGALAEGQMAWSQFSRGDIGAALVTVERAMTMVGAALRAGVTFQRRFLQVQTLTLRAIVEDGAGHLALARATLGEGLALAVEHGMRRPQASLLITLGNVERSAGLNGQALASFTAATALARDIGWAVGVSVGRYNLARCHFELGDWALALDQAVLAEQLALDCESREFEGRSLLLRGRIAAATGGAAVACELFDRAEAVFTSISAAPFVLQARSEMAQLHLQEGRVADASAAVERLAAELAAGLSLESTEDPLRPRLVCHRVWAAAGDARAAKEIEFAYAELQQLLKRSGDESTRSTVLSGMTLYREIVAAWQAQQAA